MPKISRQVGTTSQAVDIFIQNNSVTTGAGLTGLAFGTSGLTAYYHRNTASTSTAITLATATLGTWATGGFIVADGTNMPGLYQIGIPNAALASGADTVVIYLQGAANMAPVVLEIELTAVNNQSTGFGLSNASANVVQISGSNVSTSTAQLGVNVVQYNAHTAVTDSNNYPSVNLVDIAGSVVATNAAQLGVNVVNIAGTVSAATGGYVAPDWAHINAPTTTVNLSGTTISTSQAIGSVSGAVGSVTGNVGGSVASVTGAVGSVTGAVGSVSGNVGGNVTGNVTGTVGYVVNAPFKINTANGFSVFLVQSSDNKSPFTSGGVTAVRSIAGGSQVAVSGSITQVSSTNEYYFSGASADFNGTTISYIFTATGANSVYVTINTQP